MDMPRKPAASHISTPACISQVAAVCRSVCGTTLRLKTDEPDGRLKGRFHRLDRLALPLNEEADDDSALDPPPPVGEQPGRDRYRRLALIRLSCALGQPIKDATLEIGI
jgi:hypothetical protein